MLSKAGVRRRRAGSLRTRMPMDWHPAAHDEPAQEILRNTLRSACELIGAERGFVIALREDVALEIACTRAMRQHELLDAVLGPAARALHRTLSEQAIGLADASGQALPMLDGYFEHNAPAVVSLPLEVGPRQRGALCLLRADAPRTLSDLDFEILEALAGQAALALAAASQQNALSRLAASLHGFAAVPPA
ncbi:MAG TPA: GAF domain-containing protein [Solimonas sp.]|nr:GAF domain-containing protein [Solimonas sp.]